MAGANSWAFSGRILKIGINPYVLVPAIILKQLFARAGRDKGPIPVVLTIAGSEFQQHLVRYSGKWRLYLNTPMRQTAGKEEGDIIEITIAYDTSVRVAPVNDRFHSVLRRNKQALETFNSLPPSRQKEIVRYINALKTEASIERNITRAINFLMGTERFIGRDKPN